MKQKICAVIALGAVILAAGAVENYPIVSVILAAVMAAAVIIGQLWEYRDE